MNTVIHALSAKLQAVAGDESIFDACDEMYRASFLCGDQFKAGALDEVERRGLEFSVKAAVAASRGIIPPEFCLMSEQDDDADWAYESWHTEVDAIVVAPITEETILIGLCNYKGEGEGFAVYDAVKHLPKFVSKAASASFFNA